MNTNIRKELDLLIAKTDLKLVKIENRTYLATATLKNPATGTKIKWHWTGTNWVAPTGAKIEDLL